MGPEFECRREVLVPADPEEVWEAVATTEGNAAWLFPNPVNPDGPPTTAWDPPRHFAVRMEQGDWFNALEFTIEGRNGGSSLLRYVHSGIFVEDWENQYDAVQQHTDFYLHTLGEYLRHFKGRRATYIGDVPRGIAGPPSSAAPEGFDRLTGALGLERAAEGDAVRLTPTGLVPVTGVLGYRRGNFMSIRTDDALYCFFGRNAFGQPVGLSIHLFAGGADPDQVKHDWQNWLNTALA